MECGVDGAVRGYSSSSSGVGVGVEACGESDGGGIDRRERS